MAGQGTGLVCSPASLKRPVATVSMWPTRAAERQTANVSDALHTRRRPFGRPLYVAGLPVIAGTWLALDDPSATATSKAWTPRSGRSQS